MTLPSTGSFTWTVIQGAEYSNVVTQAAAGVFRAVVNLTANTPLTVISSNVCTYFPALTTFNQITVAEISTSQTVGVAISGGSSASLAQSVQLGPGGSISFGGPAALPSGYNLTLLNPVTNSNPMTVELIITGS